MLTRTELVELKDHVFEVAAESAERDGELLLLFLQSDQSLVKARDQLVATVGEDFLKFQFVLVK